MVENVCGKIRCLEDRNDSRLRTQLRKQTALKALLRGISLSEYGSEGFRVRLRGLSEYGSVAYLVERPTQETQGEQYSDTVLLIPSKRVQSWVCLFLYGWSLPQCKGANLGVFHLCHFDLLKRGPKGPRHTANGTRNEFTICTEFTTRNDSLLNL